jgi:hypothetical protein
MHIDARSEPTHRTLFIAHVDTVHTQGGSNKIVRGENEWSVQTTPKDKKVTPTYAAYDYDRGCLGADDGAGVAMLMHMLHNGVPGYYIFSQGEECGGIGAKHIANYSANLLLEFDRAVAFDRRGIDSVITRQAGGRCCSDAFAQALADSLNMASSDALFLAPDDSGVYTDTAEFTHLIPECTNISIGYEGAHSARETLDITHLKTLAAAVLAIDWDTMPTERDPLAAEPEPVVSDDEYAKFKLFYDAQDSDSKTHRHVAYTYEMEFEDAMEDAFIGNLSPLIGMISEAVWPEDPSIATKQINRRLITDEVLEWAIDQFEKGENITCILEDIFHGAQTH